jgi:hypothetical protein
VQPPAAAGSRVRFPRARLAGGDGAESRRGTRTHSLHYERFHGVPGGGAGLRGIDARIGAIPASGRDDLSKLLQQFDAQLRDSTHSYEMTPTRERPERLWS